MNDTVTTETRTTETSPIEASAINSGSEPAAVNDDVVTDRYVEPDWATRHIANPIVSRLVKMGLGVRGARELHVRGRSSGEWRTVPVNPLTIDGATFLVAPRGQTQWVRNLRAAGGGRLRIGRRYRDFTAIEVADADKVPVLRAYLDAWGFEVGKFFDGVTAASSDTELQAIAAGFPVFVVAID